MAPPTPPPTGPGPSSTGKQKRSDCPPRQPEAGLSTATLPPDPPTKKLHTGREKKKQTEKEVKSQDWHRKIAEDTKAVKKSYELHIHTLWELVTQNDAPPKITEADKAPFLAQFSTENQIRQTVTANLDANAEAIRDASKWVKKFQASLDTALENGSSSNANNMKCIKEEFLLQINDPDDLYNFLHEQCAYQTFRQIVAAYGYSFTGVNMSWVEDWAFCRKIFHSFCYSHMQKAAKIEAKSPGGLKKKNEAENVTSCCEVLADKRLDYLKAEGFPRWVIALAVETEAHSDDEFMDADPDSGRPKPVYWRKIKEGQSVKTTALFRMVDERHVRQAACQRSGNLKLEREREEPLMPQQSIPTRMPKDVPIDWFDPTFFNNELTLHEHVDLTKGGVVVALPFPQYCDEWSSCNAWKKMDDHLFMERYGKDVLATYHIPTEEEVKHLEELEAEEKDDEDANEVQTNLQPNNEEDSQAEDMVFG
ncbi:hypothetical protein DXG01_003740 [Tephrocybe rancida]|nr:hypothetical protein DXG01_003740 [Tephrocybe rancida]